MRNLLLNREYKVSGNWHAPERFLMNNFKSVIDVEMIETSSSSGDWSGFLFQKIKCKIYAIFFSQVNNYPRDGFTIYTDERVGGVCLSGNLTEAGKEAIIYHHLEMYNY